MIEAARDVLRRHYKPFWHTVGAAIRSRDGRVWTGVHLGAVVGRLAICAEVIAIGRAIMDGNGTIECAVAVRHPKPDEASQSIAVVAPCGACRETMTDYDPEALVIVPTPLGLPHSPPSARRRRSRNPASPPASPDHPVIATMSNGSMPRSIASRGR